MTNPPPTEGPATGRVRAKSVVVVNTGDGKGKSTAAFGVVMRAAAREWKIAVVQFIKSGKWNVGEEATARRLGVDWWTIGEGFSWDSSDLSEDEAVAREAWAAGRGDHRRRRTPPRGPRRDHLPDELGLDRYRRGRRRRPGPA